MMLRRRLIPVAALVVAIGASAAGAATAAATGSSGGTDGTAGGTHKSQKPVTCPILPPGGVVKTGPGTPKIMPIMPHGGDAAIAAAKAAGIAADKAAGIAPNKAGGGAADKGRPEPKNGTWPPSECKRQVKVVGIDTVASKLGVSKDALVQALTETKQWLMTSKAKPSVGQFEQHLADLLHIPVSKVAAVFDSEKHIALTPGA